MFDPRDIGSDSRQATRREPVPGYLYRPPSDERIQAERAKELERRRKEVDACEGRGTRREKMREGHRREYDPRTGRQSFEGRMARAIADVGIYRSVSFRDLADTHFDGHPYTTRRAVDRMVKDGLMREHKATGPKGGTYKVLTLTRDGARRARRCAREQGLGKEQQTWAGLVKRGELSHDTAIYRAARIEQEKLTRQGAVLNRVRIDAEMKQEIARATETARARGRKEAADSARFQAAEDMGLPIQDGEVLYPDAQLEYTDIEGRTGRVNVEIATEHYSGKSIAAKAAAGFQMHGNGAQAERAISRASSGGMNWRALRGDRGSSSGGGGRDRDKGSVEL